MIFTFLLQNHIEDCVRDMDSILPSYLKPTPPAEAHTSPDSTSSTTSTTSSNSAMVSPSISEPAVVPSMEESYLLVTASDESSRSSVTSVTSEASSSPEPDLFCPEFLSNESALVEEGQDVPEDMESHVPGVNGETRSKSPLFHQVLSQDSRSTSPLSAVDIFTDYNTSVLKAVFEQAESMAAASGKAGNGETEFSLLVGGC